MDMSFVKLPGLPERRFQMGDSRGSHTRLSTCVCAIPQKHTPLILPYRRLEEVRGACKGGTSTVGLVRDAGGNLRINMEV